MFSILAYNFVLSLAGVIMILAAVSDARTFRIPNWTSLSLLLLFPPFVFFSPVSINWQQNVVVFIVFLVIGYLLYLKKIAGAGDIKLLAVISLWAGLSQAGSYLLVTSLAGGLLTIGLLAATYAKRRLSKQDHKDSLAKIPVPYGVAIATGGLCTLALLSHPDLLSGKV